MLIEKPSINGIDGGGDISSGIGIGGSGAASGFCGGANGEKGFALLEAIVFLTAFIILTVYVMDIFTLSTRAS